MNILIITQDEPFYIPKMIKHLINSQDEKYKIIGLTVLSSHRKNKNYLHFFRERIQIYTFHELLLSGIAFIICKFYNKLNKTSPFSIYPLIEKYKISSIPSKDINSEDYVKYLESLNVDVIVSISCPQLFEEKLLSVPTKFCINAHGTLLPRHRGVFGSWWTLFNRDKIGGSTIHTMELKLDTGKILWQKEFPIERGDTQYSIAYKTKRDMAEGLVEVLTNIVKNNVEIIEPKYETSYHYAPTKEQGKEFHRQGLKVIKFRDLSLMLSKSFSKSS